MTHDSFDLVLTWHTKSETQVCSNAVPLLLILLLLLLLPLLSGRSVVAAIDANLGGVQWKLFHPSLWRKAIRNTGSLLLLNWLKALCCCRRVRVLVADGVSPRVLTHLCMTSKTACTSHCLWRDALFSSTRQKIPIPSSPSPFLWPRGSLGHHTWLHNLFPLFFSVFTALWDLANTRPVRCLMLPSGKDSYAHLLSVAVVCQGFFVEIDCGYFGGTQYCFAII